MIVWLLHSLAPYPFDAPPPDAYSDAHFLIKDTDYADQQPSPR